MSVKVQLVQLTISKDEESGGLIYLNIQKIIDQRETYCYSGNKVLLNGQELFNRSIKGNLVWKYMNALSGDFI